MGLVSSQSQEGCQCSRLRAPDWVEEKLCIVTRSVKVYGKRYGTERSSEDAGFETGLRTSVRRMPRLEAANMVSIVVGDALSRSSETPQVIPALFDEAFPQPPGSQTSSDKTPSSSFLVTGSQTSSDSTPGSSFFATQPRVRECLFDNFGHVSGCFQTGT